MAACRVTQLKKVTLCTIYVLHFITLADIEQVKNEKKGSVANFQRACGKAC
jgi:hypothetical protein